MAYEYSSESRRLDFPNPYRVENVFLLTAAAILIGGALVMFFIGRAKLASHASPWSVMPIGLGVVLLLLGLWRGGQALSQLRFFFGRGQPAGLAPELGPDEDKTSAQAATVKETVRQGALSYQEPTGALNGLLYSWIPALIFAPQPVQAFAQKQFQSSVVLLVTLASFLIAWITVPSGKAASWLGLFYFAFTAFLLFRPIRGTALLVMLILAAIFLPVLLGLVSRGLPDLSWLPMSLQTFALLLAASAATVFFFLALMHHTPPPPRTEITWKQLSLALNAHPKQLLDELEREMQKLWTEKIPNRRYERQTPQVNLAQESGEFAGQSLEETQPMPPEDMRRLTFAGAFSETRYRWLATLECLRRRAVGARGRRHHHFRQRARSAGVQQGRTGLGHLRYRDAGRGAVLLPRQSRAVGTVRFSLDAVLGGNEGQLSGGAHGLWQPVDGPHENPEAGHQCRKHDTARMGRGAQYRDVRQELRAPHRRHARHAGTDRVAG